MKRWRVLAAWLGGVIALAGVASTAWLVPRSSSELVLVDFSASIDQAERYFLPDIRIDGSSETQVRFLDWRWLTLDPRAGGLRSVGPAAALMLPTAPIEAELELDVEPVGDASAGPPCDVQIAWTGGELDRFETRGRVTRRVKIPARALGMGVNPVEIASTHARFLRLHDARLSPADKGSRREPWYPLGSFCRGQGDQARIFQVPGARLAYSVRLPPKAALRFRVPPGPHRSVVVETADGTEHEIFDSADDPGVRQRVPLAWRAGEFVRIHFRVSAPVGGGTGLAEWAAPRLVAAAPEATPDRALPRRPNIVLYVMDALRADHLQPYGYARDTSPRIAEFARRALTFERAFAHSVWTKPSVGSLLTGRLPHEHGALYDTAQMKPDVSTLAERLAQAGYTCLAYQANNNADFQRGYGLYHDQTDLVGLTLDARGPDSSRLIHDRIQSEAGRLREPFFLFIQAIDPHFPYGSPDREDRRFVRGHPLDGEPVTAVARRWMARARDETEAQRLEASYLIGLYDSSIRHNDRWFGALIDLLQARGLYDHTAVFLTADHGEGFRDHGYETGHGAFYQHTLRVPLMLKLPGREAGRRSSVPVQHLDVVPTALELAGMRDPTLSGTSLLASLGAAPPLPRSLYAMHGRDHVLRRFSTEGRAVVSWPYKLIQPNVWRALFELYDLESDPEERHNLWPGTPQLPPNVAYLQVEMMRPPLAAVGAGTDATFTPEQMEELRALGYIE